MTVSGISGETRLLWDWVDRTPESGPVTSFPHSNIYHYIFIIILLTKLRSIYMPNVSKAVARSREGIYIMLDDLLWLMVNLLHTVPIVSDVEPSLGYITRPGTTRQNPKENRRISLSVWCCAYIAHTKYGRPIISTDARVKNMATRNKIGTRPKETPVDIQTYIVPPSPHHAHLKKKN